MCVETFIVFFQNSILVFDGKNTPLTKVFLHDFYRELFRSVINEE